MGNGVSREARPDPNAEISLAHFNLLRAVGRGSFGKVRIVERRDSKRLYALKYISKVECVQMDALKNVLRERLLLEAIDHPLLVNLRFAFQDDDNMYMCLDLMLGGDLRFHITRRRFVEGIVRFWIAEVVCALRYLHNHGIVHRDIKPDNLLLDERGHVHITDFNIATKLSPGCLLQSHSGTYSYMAPEMLLNTGYDTSVDYWSLGVVFYECIYGMRPFRYDDAKQMRHAIRYQEIRYPVDGQVTVSSDCLSAMQSFLQRDVRKRLGCNNGNSSDGFRSIQQHPYFRSFDWTRLEHKQLDPPFVPDSDRSNFDITYDLEELLLEQNPLDARPKRKTNLAKMGKTKEMELIERKFKLFDYLQYERYQGVIDQKKASVGDPPEWVKCVDPVNNISEDHRSVLQSRAVPIDPNNPLPRPPPPAAPPRSNQRLMRPSGATAPRRQQNGANNNNNPQQQQQQQQHQQQPQNHAFNHPMLSPPPVQYQEQQQRQLQQFVEQQKQHQLHMARQLNVVNQQPRNSHHQQQQQHQQHQQQQQPGSRQQSPELAQIPLPRTVSVGQDPRERHSVGLPGNPERRASPLNPTAAPHQAPRSDEQSHLTDRPDTLRLNDFVLGTRQPVVSPHIRSPALPKSSASPVHVSADTAPFAGVQPPNAASPQPGPAVGNGLRRRSLSSDPHRTSMLPQAFMVLGTSPKQNLQSGAQQLAQAQQRQHQHQHQQSQNPRQSLSPQQVYGSGVPASVAGPQFNVAPVSWRRIATATDGPLNGATAGPVGKVPLNVSAGIINRQQNSALIHAAQNAYHHAQQYQHYQHQDGYQPAAAAMSDPMMAKNTISASLARGPGSVDQQQPQQHNSTGPSSRASPASPAPINLPLRPSVDSVRTHGDATATTLMMQQQPSLSSLIHEEVAALAQSNSHNGSDASLLAISNNRQQYTEDADAGADAHGEHSFTPNASRASSDELEEFGRSASPADVVQLDPETAHFRNQTIIAHNGHQQRRHVYTDVIEGRPTSAASPSHYHHQQLQLQLQQQQQQQFQRLKQNDKSQKRSSRLMAADDSMTLLASHGARHLQQRYDAPQMASSAVTTTGGAALGFDVDGFMDDGLDAFGRPVPTMISPTGESSSLPMFNHASDGAKSGTVGSNGNSDRRKHQSIRLMGFKPS